MNVSERHIEMFDRYINGELTPSWRQAFEDKLEREPKFKEAFEQHRIVVASLKNEGRKLLKSDLAAATVGMAGAGALAKYRPRSARIMSWVMKVIVATAIVAGGAYYYLNQEIVFGPPEQQEMPITPKTEEEKVKVAPVKKSSPKKSVKVERETIVDTVFVYEYDTVYVDPGSEEAKNIGTTIETETIIEYRVDTIRVE